MKLDLAIENPVQFLSQPQQERDWDMSIEDIARSINYNPYETLLTKAEREPKKYNWVQTALRAIGSSIEDMTIKAKLGKAAVETLRLSGCLDGMPRSEQMDMFDLL